MQARTPDTLLTGHAAACEHSQGRERRTGTEGTVLMHRKGSELSKRQRGAVQELWADLGMLVVSLQKLLVPLFHGVTRHFDLSKSGRGQAPSR